MLFMFSFLLFWGISGCYSEQAFEKQAKQQTNIQDSMIVDVDPIDVDTIGDEVARLDLQPHEKVWERVSWMADVATAKSLAVKTNRPIFLFSMHGELDGRC